MDGPTYDDMLDSVNDFYADRSRTQGETKDLLGQLREEINVMIDSLEDD
jgi:hypothetical protein